MYCICLTSSITETQVGFYPMISGYGSLNENGPFSFIDLNVWLPRNSSSERIRRWGFVWGSVLLREEFGISKVHSKSRFSPPPPSQWVRKVTKSSLPFAGVCFSFICSISLCDTDSTHFRAEETESGWFKESCLKSLSCDSVLALPWGSIVRVD